MSCMQSLRHPPIRALATWIGIAVVLCTLEGCAKVEPAADFERLSQTVSERTGVDSYRPDLGDAITERTERLLDGDITVEEAVEIALLNDRSFQALVFELAAARADVVQAGLLTNPSILFMARFPEGGGLANLEFSPAQELVDLWQIPVRRRVAEAQLEQALWRAAQRAIEIRVDVQSRCYEILACRLAEETAVGSMQLVSRSLELAEAQAAAGEVSPFDVNIQRDALIDARVVLVTAQRDRRTAEAGLPALLGLGRESREIRLQGELGDPVEIPSDGELIAAVLEQRFDVKLAEGAAAEAEHALQQEYRKVFPSVVLGFDIERLEQRALPGRKVFADTVRSSIANGGLTAPDIESRAQRNLQRSQIIDAILGPSLQFTLPIWDQNQAQIARARFNFQAASRRYENAINQAAGEVARAAAQVRGSLELHQLYRDQALPLARQNVESARRLYENGEQSVLVLLSAQRSEVARRASSVDILRTYWTAYAELEAAAGGSLLMVPASGPAETAPEEASR